MTVKICANCDGIIEPTELHNCIRGITDNLNRLHSNMNQLMVKKLDHLDGLKYALEIINDVEKNYRAMGMEREARHILNMVRNRIRMLLGLPYKDE